MTKLYPLPSPNRTNYENLRLPALGAAAAVSDAAHRRANDTIDSDALKQSVDNLTGHLGATLQGDDLTTRVQPLERGLEPRRAGR